MAIDPQSEDEGLNNALMEMGASLAKASSGELHVVSAWEVPDEDFLVEKMDPEKLARYAADLQSSAQASLDALLVRAGKPAEANNVHFRKGNAERTILDYVQSHQPDVVVMGTVGPNNIHGLLIGNTADLVLRQINRSVLTVKPDSLFRV